jgi:hypothetical protein
MAKVTDAELQQVVDEHFIEWQKRQQMESMND